MNFQKRKNMKALSIILTSIILLQAIMPIILPLKSNAASGNGFVETSLGKLCLQTNVTSINPGDTIPIEIYIEGNDIFGIVGYFDYDRDIFEELQDSDIEIKANGWNLNNSVDDYGTGIGYSIEMSHSRSIGLSNFTACIINLKVKNTVSNITLPAEVYFNYAVITDINFQDTSGSDGNGNNVTLQFPVITNHTVSYNANTTDIVSGMPTNGVKTNGVDYTIEQGPTRSHYTFLGWNTKNDGTGITYTPNDLYTIDADLDLYAQWDIEKSTLTINPNGGVYIGNTVVTGAYNSQIQISNPIAPIGNTVKFSANGGTAEFLQKTQTISFDKWVKQDGTTFTGPVYTFGTNDETLTANYLADGIILPNASKTGATFGGWYTAVTGGTRVGGAGDIYVPNSSETLFAQWNEQTYNLDIDTKGGTYPGTTPLTGKYNAVVQVSDPISPNGNTITLDDNNGNTTQIIQTTTFDKWTVVAGNGTLNNSSYTFGTENGKIEASYILDEVVLPTPSRDGYDFDGWSKQQTGGTKVSSPYIPTLNETLYANWIPKEYEIIFNPDGGTLSQTSKKVQYGQPIGTLPIPTKDGVDFIGWFDENGQQITENSIVNTVGNIQVKAKWGQKTYTITLDPNGGSIGQTFIPVTVGGYYGPMPAPVRDGFIFVGWIDGDGNLINETTPVDGDKTITAKWDPIVTTLTIDPSQGTYNGNTTVTGNYNTTTQVSDPIAPNGYVINFDPNGGQADVLQATQTVSFDKWVKSDGTQFVGPTYTFGTTDETLTAIYNFDDIKLPNATKQGETFNGWYTSPTGGTRVGGAGDNYTPIANQTLYAQWTVIDSLYLKSLKYKVGENDLDNYETGDIYMNKILPDTTIDEFIQNCETNGTITVYKADGSLASNTDYIGTGMTIEVTKDNEKIMMTAVVMGDIDGNGHVTITDFSELKLHLLGISKALDQQDKFLAADLDDNQNITITDFSELKLVLLGINQLSYTKPNNGKI